MEKVEKLREWHLSVLGITVFPMNPQKTHAYRRWFFSVFFVVIGLTMLLFTVNPSLAIDSRTNPVEIGNVAWNRDYEAVLAKSRESGKPIFMLFQEVPGCIGCKTFGQTVLTDPDLVMVIETAFVPIVVYNNRNSGMDRELLRKFEEPSWNYQVIRFLDHEANDIIPRKDRVWDRVGVATRMVEALEAVGNPVPDALRSITAP